ncbi:MULTISPECIES: hypothetical protein [Pasteurellaceae]|uniref:Uncharacterized protein n=2 Tax=Pasteurellales TaxID=135625 RepID=A0AAW8CKY7_9PAST|nr:hypothetical protein [Pasteurella atlantica]MDP8039347.1 hypothetical protein [Pasteurella atlantica]MDP8041439.1 hypothetical protein [Pasteurella atlantica]MDP8043636.1 hypothetical protein [Pasteurella atlantica]MDP8045660.1 hypothetical protein [Pasteurella atlantica]MDP8061515.1 hypothetical protein [Pasteurella atlantica]
MACLLVLFICLYKRFEKLEKRNAETAELIAQYLKAINKKV